MLQDTDDYSFLICPFTARKLRFLSANEIENVNARIENGDLYFHPGIQVKSKLSQALVTEHQSYIYPIFENILYLKRETAIVAKNRTENYLKRINQNVIDAFEKTYQFGENLTESADGIKEVKEGLDSNLVKSLKNKLSKDGKHFVSVQTQDVNAIHNFVFSTSYEKYIHVEFSLDRLKKAGSGLSEGTVLILADNGKLPFANQSIDTLVSFDPINTYNKSDQKVIYDDLKRLLSIDANAIVFFDESKPLHTKYFLGADKLSNTAKSVMMPWKKSKLPKFHFHGVKSDEIVSPLGRNVSKTSLNQQFS